MLLAVAGLLDAAERQLVIAVVELVDPLHAGLDLVGDAVDDPDVVGPHRRAEAVLGVVGAGSIASSRSPTRQTGSTRPERLLARDARVLRGVGDDRRVHEIARAVGLVAAEHQLAAAVERVLELLA